MPVAVEQIAQQPIFVVTVIEPFNPLKEMPTAERRFMESTATMSGKIYRIIDVTGWRIPFHDLFNVLAVDTHSGATANPQICTLIVGSREMVALGVKVRKQRQYGGIETPMFASKAEALAFAEAELAKASV